MEEQLMTNWISATEEERQLMDKARKAGVRRGINASRNVLLNMIAAGEGMTAAAALKMALEQLTNLTIEEVEG
jgi:RecJ-like exonuclease